MGAGTNLRAERGPGWAGILWEMLSREGRVQEPGDLGKCHKCPPEPPCSPSRGRSDALCAPSLERARGAQSRDKPQPKSVLCHLGLCQEGISSRKKPREKL